MFLQQFAPLLWMQQRMLLAKIVFEVLPAPRSSRWSSIEPAMVGRRLQKNDQPARRQQRLNRSSQCRAEIARGMHHVRAQDNVELSGRNGLLRQRTIQIEDGVVHEQKGAISALRPVEKELRHVGEPVLDLAGGKPRQNVADVRALPCPRLSPGPARSCAAQRYAQPD